MGDAFWFGLYMGGAIGLSCGVIVARYLDRFELQRRPRLRLVRRSGQTK